MNQETRQDTFTMAAALARAISGTLGRTELRMGRIMPAYLLAISSAAYHGGMLRQLTAWWYQGHGHLSIIPQSKRVWTTQAQWEYDRVIVV